VSGTLSQSTDRSRTRGFTLVELLVVIGIISVLIGILLPVVTKARAAANKAACLSNIRQVGMGVLMYCDRNHGWFPTCAAPANGVSDIQYPDDWLYWQKSRNLDDSPIAKCLGTKGEAFKNLLRCPADWFDGRLPYPASSATEGPYMYSYSMNDALGRNLKGPLMARTKIYWWRAPERKIMISEDREIPYRSAVWSYAGSVAGRHGTEPFLGNVPGDPNLARGARVGKAASAVFVDGHAGNVGQEFIMDMFQATPGAR
jgi:prepilin-type N-terminal cleavage/methylation domain-containing protein